MTSGTGASTPFEIADEVVAEPMRWTTVEPPPPGFWPQVWESCTHRGTLLVFDEIPSGLARTGTMFVYEPAGAVPDILVFGKGLGGGIMPMAAIVAAPWLDCAPQAALGLRRRGWPALEPDPPKISRAARSRPGGPFQTSTQKSRSTRSRTS